MLSPRFVVDENCQLSTSATWSQVPIGGLVKKFTFYGKGERGTNADDPPPGLRRCKDSGVSERVFREGLTLGLLVSMLYHRMDAQAFGI